MSTVTTATSTVDLTKVKPYGDTYNDGKVQMSFTLPVPDGEEAQEAARQYAKLMGYGQYMEERNRTASSRQPCRSR